MELASSRQFLLICYFLNALTTAGSTSCHQKVCNCREDMIFCIDVSVPSFNYRPVVTRLYMERVQLLELESIIRALPNLVYLSLVDMQYFNCDWMGEIPSNVIVTTNMCLVSTGLPLTTTGMNFNR